MNEAQVNKTESFAPLLQNGTKSPATEKRYEKNANCIEGKYLTRHAQVLGLVSSVKLKHSFYNLLGKRH